MAHDGDRIAREGESDVEGCRAGLRTTGAHVRGEALARAFEVKRRAAQAERRRALDRGANLADDLSLADARGVQARSDQE